MKHKLLSILLCLAMALSLLPTAALAEGETGTTETTIATSEELVAAIKNAQDGDTITLGKGTFTTYGNESPKKSLTFVGSGTDTIWMIGDLDSTSGGESNGDYSFDGCDTITFKNMTLKSDSADYRGFIRINNTVVDNCTIDGKTAYWGYNTAKFQNGTIFNAPEDDYALWDYSSKSMTFDDCEFNISGKGVNVYVEAGNAGSDARTVKVKDCTVISTKENKAFLNIKNSTQAYEVEITGNNTVSGLSVDTTTGSNLYQVETTTITETSGKPVKIQERAADGALTTVYEVKAPAVAEVGGTGYTTLEEALAALNGTNHTLTLLDENAWNANTPVYWKAGDQDGYAATLADALKNAYMADGDDITIICKPGSDVGTMTHGHVADNITLYGNNAYLSGGECELEVDTYRFDRATGTQSSTGDYLSQDITITAYELDNLGVWGQRNTGYTVTVNLIDCDGREISDQSNNLQRVYISGTSGANNITLTDCDFITAATAVYSNADGEITIQGCSFTGGQSPVNFNHKDSGTQTVTVKNSTFTTCGDDNTWKTFAAPLRFVNSGSGSQTITVDNTTITDTVGSNGDILLGDGRTGEQSNGVSLTITNTEAEVQAQKPGYYGADGAVSDTSLVRKTSVVNSATPVTITLDSDAFDLAQVGDTGYSNLTEAIAAAQAGGKTVTLLTADDVLLQAILDGQYGSIDGLTIELPTGSYGQLGLGRATKYVGSNTEYYVGGFDESADKYKKFDSAEDLRAYKNSGGWTPNCYYVRNMKDVTLKAAAGADVEIAGMTATAGHIYGASGAPVTDYVLDTKTESTVGSYYLAQNWSNITFDGLTFTAKVDIASSLEKTAIDGVSFENCNFNINNTASGNQALRYYNELDNEKVSGLTVDNCTFTNCFQGVYTQKIKNITVTNSTFDTTAHNAIAIQSGDKAANHGDVVITNNTFTDIGDRIIRFNNVAKGTNITITGNTATNSGDDTGEVIKATSIAEGVTTTIYSNNWGPNTTVGNDEFQDTAAPSPGGSSSYTITTKDTDNGSISVSPSRASSGRTVTITVEPDEGYVLDELTVTDSKGEKVELTKVSDTKYTFTMPRSRVTIEATFVEDPDYVEPDPSTSVADIFDDIQPGAWYEDAVQFAYDEGIMTGTSKTTFEPNTTTTRGMIVSILHRLEGNPVVTEEAFSDVSADDWYGKAVAWASSEGIVGGYGDGTFQPNKAITREEMASILYRYAQYKDQDVSARADLTKYTDADQVGAWAEEVMQWANAEGLINGMTEDTLVPQGNATRAQVAAMFQRYLNK